jgi:hypothetical protein
MVFFCGTPSLTRGRVILLYMLLALASVVFFGSELPGARDRMLLSQVWNFHFRCFLRLAGSRWRYSTPPPHLLLNLLLQLSKVKVEVKVMLRPTVSRPVCLGINHPSGAYDQIFMTVRQLRFVDVERPLWREDGSVINSCCWSSPMQSFSGSSPVWLATLFYRLRFETSLFVAYYDSKGHGGGIRLHLHKRSVPSSVGLPFYRIPETLTDHRLQSFHYCCSWLRRAGYATTGSSPGFWLYSIGLHLT